MSYRLFSLLFIGAVTMTGCQERTQDMLLKATATKANHPQAQSIQIFRGGEVTDGLDLAMIRLGENNGTERLVLDSYKWNINTRTPSVKAQRSGYYIFKYEPVSHRIIATIQGYRGFSALPSTQKKTFPASRLVKSISLLDHTSKNTYRFVIQLKDKAKINIFELKEPGRIVIDLQEQNTALTPS